MSDTEEKGTAVVEADAEEEKAAGDAVQTAIAGEEAEAGETKTEEKTEEGAEEKKEEEKAEEKVELPELSDAQRAALAKDPAMQELVKGEGTADLDSFIKKTLEEHDQTKETEKEQAAERKTLEEAEKAFEDGDPAPLARIAADNLAKARQRAEMAPEVDAAVYEQVRPFVEAEYGEIIRALKPEEVAALDKLPLVDALKDLAGRKAAAIRGESASDKEDADKAIQNASTAGAARSDGNATLPGGSAEEAVGEDIGTLMRQGMEDALDVEEAQGG